MLLLKHEMSSMPLLGPIYHYINITFFTGWHGRFSPRENVPRDDNLPCHPVKNVIFILLYGMSCFYNKFQCRVTLLCDIQNCHNVIWPIRLLEINMRYNKLIYLLDLSIGMNSTVGSFECRCTTWWRYHWRTVFYVVYIGRTYLSLILKLFLAVRCTYMYM